MESNSGVGDFRIPGVAYEATYEKIGTRIDAGPINWPREGQTVLLEMQRRAASLIGEYFTSGPLPKKSGKEIIKTLHHHTWKFLQAKKALHDKIQEEKSKKYSGFVKQYFGINPNEFLSEKLCQKVILSTVDLLLPLAKQAGNGKEISVKKPTPYTIKDLAFADKETMRKLSTNKVLEVFAASEEDKKKAKGLAFNYMAQKQVVKNNSNQRGTRNGSTPKVMVKIKNTPSEKQMKEFRQVIVAGNTQQTSRRNLWQKGQGR